MPLAKAKTANRLGVRAKAKAKAKARAQIQLWNTRRQRRREVIQELNQLSTEVGAERLALAAFRK